MILRLVLLREDLHVLREIGRHEDPLQVLVQGPGAADHLRLADSHELSLRLLEPRQVDLGKLLQLAAETAEARPGTAGRSALEPPIATEEDDDAIPFVQVRRLEQQRLAAVLLHARTPPPFSGPASRSSGSPGRSRRGCR